MSRARFKSEPVDAVGGGRHLIAAGDSGGVLASLPSREGLPERSLESFHRGRVIERTGGRPPNSSWLLKVRFPVRYFSCHFLRGVLEIARRS